MKVVTLKTIKKRGKGREMSDIDGDNDIEGIKKKGKRRGMSDINEDSDIGDIKKRGNGEREE